MLCATYYNISGIQNHGTPTQDIHAAADRLQEQDKADTGRGA